MFVFRKNNQYNLLHLNDFQIPPLRSVYRGSESLSYLGPKIWEIIPTEIEAFFNSFEE